METMSMVTTQPSGMFNGAIPTGVVRAQGYEKAIVKFFTKTVENPVRTREAGGVKKFDNVEYISVSYPGAAPLEEFVTSLTDEWRERFPSEYEAWKRTKENVVDGFPLEMWPVLDPARVEEFKHMGLRTVENIANIADNVLQRVGLDARQLRDKAKDFISMQKGDFHKMETLRSEHENLKQSYIALKQTTEELAKKLSEITNTPQHRVVTEDYAMDTNLEAPAKRGPGRPRKIVTNEPLGEV